MSDVYTDASLQNQAVPIVDSAGRATRQFWMLIVALLNRTGGDGSPIDIGTLEKQVTALEAVSYVLATAATNLPNGLLLTPGNGMTVTVNEGEIIIALHAPVSVPNGGTALTTMPDHEVLIGNGVNAPNFTAPGAAGQALVSNGTTADPTFQLIVNAIMAGTGINVSANTGSVTISLATPVPVTEGGTGVSTLNPSGVLVGNGGGPVVALATGSAGQVLTSAGVGVNPSMQPIPNQPGRLINVQRLTATTTYTKTAGTNSQIVELQAPGGSGGGASGTGTAQSAAAAGGGAGAFARVYFATAVTGVTVTLPTGPSGATAGGNNGTAGTAATFGGYVSCPGGNAGSGGATASTAAITGASGRTSLPTVSTVGGVTPTAINLVPGSSGGVGLVASPGAYSMGGHGGPSPMYPAPFQDKAGSGAGVNAAVSGEGGGGGNQAAASGAAAAGGNAGGAECVVYEFA
ncbi:hypothetical protein [Paraburkholderia silvatlantica]|uniref:Uncharacterized protein n=1 Tax=Paraburkholderia silvatlantica TaxID=321895 RepID=A0ABR6FMW9_9BURK|nr:hypothetical protein [Paraburkholderia silvatlantica]MBB2928393.1 hypothetical protein [Paraburkholderia silvatlantica]PVY34562.1 hypothetical protein C7411_10798 [Paraburkholderia silvatlantica]PXW38777.1 hypothetical protein C7413_10798 [Paraburkholderia silvatlantica]